MSPYIDKDKGNGTIDLSELTVKCNETVISNWSISSVSYDPMPDESSISGKELTVTPGTYRITITIINNDNPLIVYNSYILEQEITVYSNLTTTVTGSISLSINSILELKPIGGVISYVAEEGNGATYTFYDSSKKKIEPLGGSFTVENLLDAEYYTVSGKAEGADDRFFVLYTEDFLFNREKQYDAFWGFKNIDFVKITADSTGKSNKAIILKYIEENDLLKEDPSDSNNTYKNCGEGIYMWDYLIDFNDETKTSSTGNTTELYDWYIPSSIEMTNILTKKSIINGKLNYVFNEFFMTSSLYDANHYYSVHKDYGRMNSIKEGGSNECVVIRSF